MKKFVIIGLLVSVFVGFVLSPFASSLPDGLERVAINYGFVEKEKKFLKSPFEDYNFALIKNEKLATSFAGLLGTGLIFLSVVGIFRFLQRK